MRVCMLVYNQCHRDARVLKEAATLAAAGHAVTIVAVGVEGDASVELRDGFRILRIRRNPPHVRAFDALVGALPRRPGESAGDAFPRVPAASSAGPPPRHPHLGTLARLVFSTLRRGMRRVHRPLMFIDWWVRVVRGVAPHGVDVVHAHDVLTLPAGAALARRTGARLIYDAHELYSEVSTLSARERRTWDRIERVLAPRADTSITVCDSIADEMVARYAIRRPVVLLNCPEAPKRAPEPGAALRRHAGLAEDGEPLVLYHGGFAPNRGIEQLIDAFALLRGGRLVLMGWGAIEAGIRAKVAAMRLGGRVVVVGPVPRERLLEVAAGAAVGVIPYRAVGLNNYYATPNKLFELIAAGVPIAASRFPELERFVGGLGLGELFDPDDPADIARAIALLLDDPQRRERARANARRAAARFTWEVQETTLRAVYDAKSNDSQRGRIASGDQRSA